MALAELSQPSAPVMLSYKQHFDARDTISCIVEVESVSPALVVVVKGDSIVAPSEAKVGAGGPGLAPDSSKRGKVKRASSATSIARCGHRLGRWRGVV